MSSSLVANFIPISSSLGSSLIESLPVSLSSRFPLFATSISLFFLTMPFLVAKIIRLSCQVSSSKGRGKNVAIFSSLEKGSKFTIGLPLALRDASGIS